MWYLVWTFFAYTVTAVLILYSNCTFHKYQKKFFLVQYFIFKKWKYLKHLLLWKEWHFYISNEWNKTHSERVFFYFSLICGIHVCTFAIWVTPGQYFIYSSVSNKCPPLVKCWTFVVSPVLIKTILSPPTHTHTRFLSFHKSLFTFLDIGGVPSQPFDLLKTLSRFW